MDDAYLIDNKEVITTPKKKTTEEKSYGAVILDDFEAVPDGFDITLSKTMLDRLTGRMFTALAEGKEDTRYCLTVIQRGKEISIRVSTKKAEE